MRRLFLCILILGLSFGTLANARLDGAFWQLNSGLLGRGDSFWQDQLEAMVAVEMDTIIIQYSQTSNQTYYANGSVLGFKFQGSFDAGDHVLTIYQTPVILTEIQAATSMEYEIIGPPPGSFLGDDGYKLMDGVYDFLAGGVGWAAEDEPVQIRLSLSESVEEITVYVFPTQTGQIPNPQIMAIGETTPSIFWTDDDYNQLLAHADRLGMKVWLGLRLSDGWWSGQLDLKKEIQDNLQVARELEELYGHYESFVGWYIPHEIYPTPNFSQRTIDFFAELSKELKKTGRPVSIAPYFGANLTPKQHAAFWDRFLSQVPLDVLMLQDGVGCHRLRASQIPAYYQEIAPAVRAHGVEFWSDLEVFDTVTTNPLVFEPSTFPRVKEQLISQAPLVDKIVIFDWPHYMSPFANQKARDLFHAYQVYLQE